MSSETKNGETKMQSKVVVSGSDIESVANAINATIESEKMSQQKRESESRESKPEGLFDAFDALEDAIEGLRIATEKDSRGKMRKKVMEYSGRDDMANWEFGRHLEILKTHGIAEKDGKRWRLAD